MKKVVLAFSGGLDTTFCAVYLKQELDCQVISVTVDTGGFAPEELEEIGNRARSLGVSKHYTVDGRERVYNDFISYIIKANSLRGNTYPLSVGAERVAQAIEVCKIAQKENAQAVAHGSTGAGNDQIRFDVAFSVLLPDREIVAPIRSLGWSRKEEASWLRERGVQVQEKTRDYSVNEGLWGTTIGGKQTHDPWEFPPDHVFKNTGKKEEIPQEPQELVIDFNQGLPVSINGERKRPVELVAHLNQVGAGYGIGRGVHLGDTILGIKGRIVFEAPAPLMLICAHRELEKLVLSKHQRFWKDHLGQVYGDMLHEGQYFDPVMRDIEALIDSSQAVVTGSAKLVLSDGGFLVSGVKSPHSLMRTDMAVYGEHQKLWDYRDAEGFSRIYGVPSKLYSMVNKNKWLQE
ncbi:MAG: argininosuccinate synthase [Spirochaetota bacterium]